LCFLSFRSDRARSSLTSRALRMPCPHSGVGRQWTPRRSWGGW
jgi:hypothetical protein